MSAAPLSRPLTRALPHLLPRQRLLPRLLSRQPPLPRRPAGSGRRVCVGLFQKKREKVLEHRQCYIILVCNFLEETMLYFGLGKMTN
jgi:hypothetical protein